MNITLDDYNVFGQAYFIVVGLNGSWMYDALYEQLKDEEFCKKIVGEYKKCYGSEVLSDISSDISSFIHDSELPPSHFIQVPLPRYISKENEDILFNEIVDIQLNYGVGSERDVICYGYPGLDDMSSDELVEHAQTFEDHEFSERARSIIREYLANKAVERVILS